MLGKRFKRIEEKGWMAARLHSQKRRHVRRTSADDVAELEDCKANLRVLQRILHGMADRHGYPEWVWPGLWKEQIMPLVSENANDLGTWKAAIASARVLMSLFHNTAQMNCLMQRRGSSDD